MTPEQAWETYHDEIERVCRADTYGDPATDRDNKAPISTRAMRVVFLETWRLALSVGLGD